MADTAPLPRIFHIHLGLDHGGAETFFVKLANAFSRRAIPQSAVVVKGRIWAPKLPKAGFDLHELPLRKGLRGFIDNLRIKRLVKQFKPDVVMVWMNRAARRAPAGPWLTVGRLGGYYNLKYYKKCDHLVGNTPDLVDYFVREGWPTARSHMISNFPDMKAEAPVKRQDFDVPDTAPLLIALGRLEEMKAFDTLLDAVAKLPDAYLWLLGEGSLRGALTAQAEQLGIAHRVRLMGWIANPAAYIAAADIFVVPSRHEPLGNVILEAWALGKPVVSAASEGPKWLVQDGDNGLLVPVDDAGAMAHAIGQIAEHKELAQKLIAGGNRTLTEKFSESAIVEAYLDLFSKPKS